MLDQGLFDPATGQQLCLPTWRLATITHVTNTEVVVRYDGGASASGTAGEDGGGADHEADHGADEGRASDALGRLETIDVTLEPHRLGPCFSRTIAETMGQKEARGREAKFREMMQINGLGVRDVTADGNCLFRAVAHQVLVLVRSKTFLFTEGGEGRRKKERKKER